MRTELTITWGEPVPAYPVPAVCSPRRESLRAVQPGITAQTRHCNPWQACPGAPRLEALFAGVVAAGMLAIEIRIFTVALLG